MCDQSCPDKRLRDVTFETFYGAFPFLRVIWLKCSVIRHRYLTTKVLYFPVMRRSAGSGLVQVVRDCNNTLSSCVTGYTLNSLRAVALSDHREKKVLRKPS